MNVLPYVISKMIKLFLETRELKSNFKKYLKFRFPIKLRRTHKKESTNIYKRAP